MFFRIFILLLFLHVPSVRAQLIRRLTLDGRDGAMIPTEDIAGGNLYLRQVSTPVLELFPAPSKPSSGTIMIFPGGGFKMLHVEREGRNVAQMLNGAGWDAAVLIYPVSPGPDDTRIAALNAAEKAWDLLQLRGSRLGLSTAKLGVMGFSAGGYLAARLAHATVASGTAPGFLVLMYPAYLNRGDKLLDEVAPMPVPVFLCVGERDSTLASTDLYAAVCKEQGIRCDYVVVLDAGHGFGLTADLPTGVRAWPEKLKAFLNALPPGKSNALTLPP